MEKAIGTKESCMPQAKHHQRGSGELWATTRRQHLFGEQIRAKCQEEQVWGGSIRDCCFLENEVLYCLNGLQGDEGQTLLETPAASPPTWWKKQRLWLPLLTTTCVPSVIKPVPFLPLRSSTAATLLSASSSSLGPATVHPVTAKTPAQAAPPSR